MNMNGTPVKKSTTLAVLKSQDCYSSLYYACIYLIGCALIGVTPVLLHILRKVQMQCICMGLFILS